MLPPCSADVAVEMACPPSGATPKQPSMGTSGMVRLPSFVAGEMSVAVPASLSMRHSAIDPRPGSSATYQGSTTLGATEVLV
jgi:hypothetical protein